MRVDVPAVAPYALDGATQTGTGDVWADDSDATYVTVNDSAPPIANYGRGTVRGRTTGGFPLVPTHAATWVRYRVSGPPPIPRLIISGIGASYDAIGSAEADPEPGWLRVKITDSGGYVWNWRADYACTLQLSAQFSAGTPVVIYEAAVSFEWHGDAPPCRILQRRDGLGLGAGVAYPPPKSQQRSPGNRGVGFY